MMGLFLLFYSGDFMTLEEYIGNPELFELLREYHKGDNYQIINNPNSESNTCYIFFSSHGLYLTKKPQEVQQILDSDHYEWTSIAGNKRLLEKAKKIIFLRDVYRGLYLYGINDEINTVDKIKEFLLKETEGMDVILAGSSGGGYMALVMAGLLPNTKRVLSLGGVVETDTLKTYGNLYEFIKDDVQYPNIASLINKDCYYIHFHGVYNSYDEPNADILKKSVAPEKLISIGILTSGHAPRADYATLLKLLTYSDEKIGLLVGFCKENNTYPNAESIII